MILVRYVFQVKWGMTHQVLEAFKKGEESMGDSYGRWRILTDLSGPFNTVVQEVEVESLAEWERGRAEIFAKPEFQKMMADTADLFESGRVEFYTIES
jgi:hypothetical protein